MWDTVGCLLGKRGGACAHPGTGNVRAEKQPCWAISEAVSAGGIIDINHRYQQVRARERAPTWSNFNIFLLSSEECFKGVIFPLLFNVSSLCENDVFRELGSSIFQRVFVFPLAASVRRGSKTKTAERSGGGGGVGGIPFNSTLNHI